MRHIENQMKAAKPIALGCVLLFIVAGACFVVAAPDIQVSAHRRELGRGTQTLVELLWPMNDLFADLATASGSLVGQPLILDQTVTLKYAGPYGIVLRTQNSPRNPLPSSTRYPTVEVSISTARGSVASTNEVRFNSPFWGQRQGFVLFHFDAPGAIPIDELLNVSVVVKEVPPEFVELYGPTAEVAVKRFSSE